MNPHKKRHIIQELIEITGKAEDFELAREQPKRFKGANGRFALSDQALSHYREVEKLLLTEEDWGAKFSEQYICRAIDNLLSKVEKLANKEEGEPILDQLLQDLSTYSDELTVYLPISGLSMDIDSLEIGNIVLKRATDDFLEHLTSQLGSIIYAREKPDPSEQFLRRHERRRLARYKGSVFSEYRVIAEKERAVERALIESRRVLDLLWMFVPFSNSHSNSRFHISMERIRPLEMSVFSVNKFYSFHSQRRFLPFHLRGEIINQMADRGIFEVGCLLKKTQASLTHFEETLIRGIHWYAAARAQSESENEFLNLMVSLEAFLSVQGEPITTYIAEGSAIILAENISDRLEIKTMVKSLYRTRSGISHGGHKAITDSDLEWLRIAVSNTIFWMIENRSRFSSRTDLGDWLELKKLGGP
jgi:hypothetical protein